MRTVEEVSTHLRQVRQAAAPLRAQSVHRLWQLIYTALRFQALQMGIALTCQFHSIEFAA